MFPLYDANPTKNFPIVTVLIIAFTFFVWLVVQGAGQEEALYNSLCQYASANHTYYDNAGFPDDDCFQQNIGYPSLVTSIFIHGDWFHLIFNLWYLWIFGNNIEDAFGRLTFLFFYLLTGVLTEVCSIIFYGNEVMLSFGASGSIAAVLGAYLVIFRNAKVLVFLPFVFKFSTHKKQKAKPRGALDWIFFMPSIYLIIIYVLIDLSSFIEGFLADISDGINTIAHLSGYMMGAAVAFVALKAGALEHVKPSIQAQNKNKAVDPEINPYIYRIIDGFQIVYSWVFVLIPLLLIIVIAGLLLFHD